VSRGQSDGSLRPHSRLSRPEPRLFLPSRSSIVLMRLSGPLPDPLFLRKSDSAGNRTRISGSVASNSDHCTTEAVLNLNQGTKIGNEQGVRLET
jgi:hypothetical protein